jgi:hypothetical protein
MSDNYRLTASGISVPAFVSTSKPRDLIERIAELETGNDDGGAWLTLGGEDFEFSRSFVTDTAKLARIFYLKNPLIRRGCSVKADYVFGRRVSISARDELINDVVQIFLNDERNQTEFTSHAARLQKEIELQTDANIFFVLLPEPRSGRVRMRTIPADEVTEIISNPADKKESWYYKREWIEKRVNLETGQTEDAKQVAYYQDWRYAPAEPVTKIGGSNVIAGAFVYHIKTGGFSEWKFGISELYAGLSWAKAYTKFLENWATIVSAYARFAFKVTTAGGKKGMDAAKRKLSTTLGVASAETNPAPAAGASIVMQDGNDIAPIRTAGATTTAEDGRRLLLMVAATFGLPETFFGDVSVGTLATATSLDRPTELMLANRQALWADIYNDILQFVIKQAVIAPDGALRSIAQMGENEYGEAEIVFDDGVDPTLNIAFPSVVEIDPGATINAIIAGATFDGKQPSIINDPKLLARMVLVTLGVNDVDTIVNELYPEDGPPPQLGETEDDPESDPNQLPPPDEEIPPAVEALREALEAIRTQLAPLHTPALYPRRDGLIAAVHRDDDNVAASINRAILKNRGGR